MLANFWQVIRCLKAATRRSVRACRVRNAALPALVFFTSIISISAKSEVSNQQAAEIVNDLGNLANTWNEQRVYTWQSYLANISAYTSTFYSDFNNILRPSITNIANYVSLIRQEVAKENTNLTNIVGRVNFWGTALDNDFQTANRYLLNTVQNLQSIDYNLWEAYKGETNLLTRIYDQMTTNLVQNANEMLSQLSNINLWVEEQLYTNSTHYAEVELALSNLFNSANAMSNNVFTIDSNVAIMKDTLSSVTNSLADVTNYLYSTMFYTTNTFNQFIIPYSSNRSVGNAVQSRWDNQFSSFYNGDYSLASFLAVLDDGLFYTPGSSFTSSGGVTRNLFEVLTSIYGNSIYQAVWEGINNEILTNAYNNVTNKTQSIPYTVILPEMSAATGSPNIFGALTNAYLTSYNQQSDKTWFDRVELLLASLVFQESNTNGNENSWSLDTSVTTAQIDTSYGQYQTGVQGLQSGISNYKNTALGLLTNIRSKFDGVQNNGIEWNIGGDDNAKYFGIDTSNQFFTVLRTISIICWSCAFLFFIIKLFAFISPYVFKGFKLAFNVISALIMR